MSHLQIDQLISKENWRFIRWPKHRLFGSFTPREHAITVHELGKPPLTLHEGGVLTGGTVLPGFSLPVAMVFSDPQDD